MYSTIKRAKFQALKPYEIFLKEYNRRSLQKADEWYSFDKGNNWFYNLIII